MNPVLRPFLAVSLCSLLLCLPAAPQSQQSPPDKSPQPPPPAQAGEQPNTRISVSVNEVIVPVTVTDDKGKFVSNLTAADFRVLDEGKPQRIRFFSHDEKQPIVVGFLVDMSSSMRVHWKTFQDAILELVWNLLPGDPRYRGYLISYGNDAELRINTTMDSEKIAAEVRKLKPGGGAALYDAIYRACTTRELVKGEPYEPRRVLIVVGDGHNSAGTKSLEEVLELAQRNLVTIYGISTMAFGFANEDQDVLERLAQKTGGRVEYPLVSPYKDVSGYLSNPSDAGNYALTVGTGGYAAQIAAGIFKAIQGISGEVTTQYILRYIPDVDPEAKAKVARTIKVEIPTLPTVKIRAREYYYPAGVPGAPPTGGAGER